ncbi:hypothetical protein V5799_021522 [Amblyomma americanum]|uniref:SUN domain-containing protein n=1 Tax=Amblyomma americanum TaxID=6943 RepID=A0AAQ4FQJ5_AMBAM
MGSQCTCCCKEDVENDIADIARTNGVKQASHTAAATSDPEVPTQEFPEHSKHLHSVSPHQSDDLHVPPPVEVITQGVGLSSASSGEKQEELESSLSASDIAPALDDKPRETTEALESDQAPVTIIANQAPDQTNDTEHMEAVTPEPITETQRRTTEESVFPGTKQDQEPQGPDDTSVKEPVEGKEDSFVPSPPTEDKVETREVPESALKKEGDEGTEHDRKESAEKMPTFVEWKQKMLAEHEKGGEQPPEVGSSLPKKKPTGSKSRRNYASYECGAKVLAANAEADGAGRVLNEQMDEYMLNPCKAKIWFVVELCEMIQVSQIDIANFELFSSMPKDFAVLMSDRYPTRDWTPLGTFTAHDRKVVQSFELHSEAYGKYIKVELLSRYGSEHYCPLSLLRVFGASMIDDYEQLVEKPRDPSAPDDDEEETSTEGSASKNVVDRAKDVVISLLKVLRRDQEGGVDLMASAPCSDLNANCSILNVSHQVHNATSGQLGCQRNRSRHFFDSVFQQCSTCSRSRGHSTDTQTPSETIACRFLRTALSLEDSCTIDKPDKAPELYESTESSSSNFLVADSSEFTATSSTVEVAVSSSAQVRTMPSASAVNDTSEVEASKSVAMPSSETAQPESTKAFSSPSSVTTVSSSETSISVDLSHCDNETTLEDFGDASELAQKDSTASHTSTDSMTLQSSSQVSDSTADSATATPVIVDVPTSVKTSPSSTSVAGIEVASPVMDSALPNDVTTVSGVSPPDVDSGGVLIIGTLDELVPDVDLQLREGGIRAPPPEAGALALSSQRESVFMRINNRIKALELNMSLSGQYLEELSRRYRHQMDEMQRAFNRTVNALNKTAQKAAEKVSPCVLIL